MTRSQRPLTAAEHATKKTHESVIRIHLSGGRVEKTNLWAAVGYFHDGGGSAFEKPCSEELWTRLLEESGRIPTATLDSFSGNFRYC